MESGIKKVYLANLEILRVIAIFAIICRHLFGFPAFDGNFVKNFLGNLDKFAVPVFFLISGYLYAKSVDEKKHAPVIPWTYLRKLFVIFIAWTVFYRILKRTPIAKLIQAGIHCGLRNSLIHLYHRSSEALVPVHGHPGGFFIDFFMRGYFHLWFLPALGVGILLLAVFIQIKKEKYIILFALFLYLVGLQGSAYSSTPLGSAWLSAHFNTRNGPFFSTIFVALGWLLYVQRDKRSSWPSAVSLAVLGFFMQWAEGAALVFYTRHLFILEYSLGTLLFGAGVFRLALALPEAGQDSVIVKMGRLVGGIYLTHILMIMNIDTNLLRHLLGPLGWKIFYPVLVFFCSLGLTFFLRKFKFTRWLIP